MIYYNIFNILFNFYHPPTPNLYTKKTIKKSPSTYFRITTYNRIATEPTRWLFDYDRSVLLADGDFIAFIFEYFIDVLRYSFHILLLVELLDGESFTRLDIPFVVL